MEQDKDIKKLEYGRWKTPGYYDEIHRFYLTTIPKGSRILELGCGTGRLIADLEPGEGMGVDIDAEKIEAAKEFHKSTPNIIFKTGDVENMDWHGIEPFDYIIISDLVPRLKDVQTVFERLHPVCTPSTRIILNFPSNLWRPILKLAVLTGFKMPDKIFNWLSHFDVSNLLYLADFEVISKGARILIPLKIKFLTPFFNRFLAKLPLLRHLCLMDYIIARPCPMPASKNKKPSVSVLIPTRDEKGNIEDAFLRTPQMGSWTELVFIDGHSTDGTIEEIKRCMEKYKDRWGRVKLVHQTGKGKGQAVRQGFDECKGDILMILDSDLTMPPEELPKYYNAIVSGKGEFVNGCRLVYPMEKKAMRFLNMVANYFFANLFSWLLNQPVKDTLCGTKVLWKHDYEDIAKNRSYFGDFDPFGDFDLLFGAARLNRKIVDMPITYRERTYGDIKIERWKHGLLLFRMSFVGFKKLKLT